MCLLKSGYDCVQRVYVVSSRLWRVGGRERWSESWHRETAGKAAARVGDEYNRLKKNCWISYYGKYSRFPIEFAHL